MAYNTMASLSSTTSRNPSSYMPWTHSNILALVLVLLTTITCVGAVSLCLHRCYRRGNLSRSQAAVDLEAASKDEEFEFPVDGSSSSIWSSLTVYFSRSSRPAEPNCIWPILTVLPSLRKVPFHRRVFNAITFWRKKDIERVPLTVGDGLKDMEEADTRGQGKDALYYDGGAWLYHQAAEVPKIIIHPCDSKPSVPLNDWSEFTSQRIVNRTSSDSSAPAHAPSCEPDFRTATESPSATAFSERSSTSTAEYLEVPLLTSTVVHENEVTVNISNVSREAFILRAPPMAGRRRRGSTAALPGGACGEEASLESVCTSSVALSTGEPGVFEDASESAQLPAGLTPCAFGSDASVVDLVSALEAAVADTNPSFDPTESSRYSRLLDALNTSFSRSSLDALSLHSHSRAYSVVTVDSSCDEDDSVHDDAASDASGETDYYECSTESIIGLDYLTSEDDDDGDGVGEAVEWVM